MNEQNHERTRPGVGPGDKASVGIKTRSSIKLLVIGLFMARLGSALAEVRYVDANGVQPAAPYTNWSTAAVTIQQAVEASTAGDEVVVTNGAYAQSGKTVYSTLTRVAIDKPITVRSVNGPRFTIIDGGGLARCAYLTNLASLSGFTLTNGISQNGGGGGLLCDSTNAVVTNCVLAGNSAQGGNGGGCFQGTLKNCRLTANSATYGGAANSSALIGCTLAGNSGTYGGAAYYCTLYDCAVTANSATYGGGGVDYSTLNNCTLSGNSSLYSGGGAMASSLTNCIVY
ncbi:MAG: hypothetical protein ACREIC_10980, partial [Limisphaerales bacterium]